ncbi:MAG TPA: type II secretion system protein [Tepidisphaeraceae bacterium]|nr:type II secretion system protein [Tepidisphaeraceae bacterium]
MIQWSDVSIRRAFTLIELLVVIGIMVLLIGILVPVLSHARAKARKIRLQADLQTISSALEAYRSDFGDYPRPEAALDGSGNLSPASTASCPNPPTGAEILCRALIAPAPAVDANASSHTIPWQDGADGPGFRLHGIMGSETTPQGRVYGPYLNLDTFKIYSYDPINSASSVPYVDSSDASFNPLLAFIADADGNPILYFPARPAKPDISDATNHYYIYPSSQTGHNRKALFDSDDNWAYMHHLYQNDQSTWRSSADATEGASTSSYQDIGYDRICIMLGDYNASNPSAATNCDGAIDATGERAVTQPFVLWCAGDDGKFGTDSTTPTSADLSKLDDATNIQ